MDKKIANDSPLHEEFSEILLFHRKKAGLNREELAKLAGVGKKAIFDLEHAKPSVQFNTLLKVLKALNIQLKMDSPLMGIFPRGPHEKS